MARKHPRNNALFDSWSVVHFSTGVLMGWTMSPFIALALMVLWEPFEVLFLSPLLAKWKIEFGYETIQNSLSDIVFDTLGIIIGFYVVSHFFELPFRLLG